MTPLKSQIWSLVVTLASVGGQCSKFVLFLFRQFNLTHHIKHLSFGEKYPGIKNPLDDTFVPSEISKEIIFKVDFSHNGRPLRRGNGMISSAIWVKHARVSFLNTFKNPQVRVFSKIAREIMLLLINNIHDKTMQN